MSKNLKSRDFYGFLFFENFIAKPKFFSYNIIGKKPRWRNWFTRAIQNRIGEILCGFESHPRHYIFYHYLNLNLGGLPKNIKPNERTAAIKKVMLI